MNKELAVRLGEALIKIGNDFKACRIEITETEAIDLFRVISHEPMSREQVCVDFNLSNNKFYDLIALHKIPKGRKRRGFKELYWYRDEIVTAIQKLKHDV